MRIRRVVVVIVAAVLLISAGSATAVVPGNSAAEAPYAQSAQSAGAIPLPSAPQAEFVPITPCRYLDTRSEGGTFSGAISRSYPRRCGVPVYAKSLAVSISAVGPAGNGFLRAGVVGGPMTTVVNYTRSESITTGAQIPVDSAGIRLLNSGGPTHVTVDVTGYYQQPMYAIVAYDGGVNPFFRAASRATSVTKDQSSKVLVAFDRDITFCNIQVTTDFVGTTASARHSLQTVVVTSRNSLGATVLAGFYVRVTC